jgi:hypothetical protein
MHLVNCGRSLPQGYRETAPVVPIHAVGVGSAGSVALSVGSGVAVSMLVGVAVSMLVGAMVSVAVSVGDSGGEGLGTGRITVIQDDDIAIRDDLDWSRCGRCRNRR